MITCRLFPVELALAANHSSALTNQASPSGEELSHVCRKLTAHSSLLCFLYRSSTVDDCASGMRLTARSIIICAMVKHSTVAVNSSQLLSFWSANRDFHLERRSPTSKCPSGFWQASA